MVHAWPNPIDRKTREVRAKVIPYARPEVLQKEIQDQVIPGSKVYKDGAGAYATLAEIAGGVADSRQEANLGRPDRQGPSQCLRLELSGDVLYRV